MNLGPTNSDDPEVLKFFFADTEVLVRRKFKRLKFLRMISTDPVGALDLALAPGELDRLSEMDMSQDDLGELMEALAATIAGTSRGN